MQDWIAAQLAAGLPAFAGSRLSGTVAVTPEVINEFIARWLAGSTAPTAPAAVDPVLARTAVKSARVRAEQNRILIDIEISL